MPIHKIGNNIQVIQEYGQLQKKASEGKSYVIYVEEKSNTLGIREKGFSVVELIKDLWYQRSYKISSIAPIIQASVQEQSLTSQTIAQVQNGLWILERKLSEKDLDAEIHEVRKSLFRKEEEEKISAFEKAVDRGDEQAKKQLLQEMNRSGYLQREDIRKRVYSFLAKNDPIFLYESAKIYAISLDQKDLFLPAFEKAMKKEEREEREENSSILQDFSTFSPTIQKHYLALAFKTAIENGDETMYNNLMKIVDKNFLWEDSSFRHEILCLKENGLISAFEKAVCEGNEQAKKRFLQEMNRNGYLQREDIRKRVYSFLAKNDPIFLYESAKIYAISLDQKDLFLFAFEDAMKKEDPSARKQVLDILSTFPFSTQKKYLALAFKSAMENNQETMRSHLMHFMDNQGFFQDEDFRIGIASYLAKNDPAFLCAIIESRCFEHFVQAFVSVPSEVMIIGCQIKDKNRRIKFMDSIPEETYAEMQKIEDEYLQRRKDNLEQIKDGGGICLGYTIALLSQENQSYEKILAQARFIHASYEQTHARRFYDAKKLGDLILQTPDQFPTILTKAKKILRIDPFKDKLSSEQIRVIGKIANSFYFNPNEISNQEMKELEKIYENVWYHTPQEKIPKQVLAKANLTVGNEVIKTTSVENFANQLKKLGEENPTGKFSLGITHASSAHAIYVSFQSLSFCDTNDLDSHAQPKLKKFSTIEEMCDALHAHLSLTYPSITEIRLTEYKNIR